MNFLFMLRGLEKTEDDILFIKVNYKYIKVNK